MTLSYRLARAFLSALFRAFSHYEVVGRENLPPHGPAILAMNHIHMLDSPAAMVAMPWQVRIMAANKWSGHPLGLFLRFVGAIFVRRGEVDRQALRWALAMLKRGEVFGIAPEGTRSPTHQLQPARGGVAYLAYASGAPILPVVVTGVEDILPSLLRLRRAHVRVAAGPMFYLPRPERRPRSDELLEMADQVMYHLAALLPREYRGVYAGNGKIFQRTPAPQN